MTGLLIAILVLLMVFGVPLSVVCGVAGSAPFPLKETGSE